MNTQATPYQIGLLHHTLGLSERRRESFRNHFVAGNGHRDMRHLEALERAGLMERRRTPGFLEAGDIVFAATDEGHEAALAALPEPMPPRKRSRYEDYLDADGCGGDSFGEFLCGSRLPEFEERRPLFGSYRAVEYRVFRRAYSHTYDRYGYHDVEGEWRTTKKDAKASYKAALKARAMRTRQPGLMLEPA